jgi:putative Mg2+ transporter-C (MgtC) family protein
MDIFIEELMGGLPDKRQVARLIIRLGAAALLGAIVGIQREHTGKPAGVRTHMLVSMGAALFVLAPIEFGMDTADLSRIIQGLATGLGFIGGGAILKLRESREIRGLTSAAVIWMTAAMGVAAGLGRLGLAFASAALTWIVLSVIGILEERIEERWASEAERGGSRRQERDA